MFNSNPNTKGQNRKIHHEEKSGEGGVKRRIYKGHLGNKNKEKIKELRGLS